MKTIEMNQVSEEAVLEEFNNRTEEDLTGIDNIVFNIISRVRQSGDEALKAITKEIDQVDLKEMLVTQEEIDEIVNSVVGEKWVYCDHPSNMYSALYRIGEILNELNNVINTTTIGEALWLPPYKPTI